MRPRWHHSLLARTGLVLVVVLALLGTLTVALNLHYSRIHAEDAIRQRLGQLLDTVESTVSIACFTKDDVLARELVSGLLRNSEVLSVSVRADDVELASQGRPRHDEASTPISAVQPLVRDIHSPFSPELRVGRVLLVPNRAMIDKALGRETRLVVLQIVIQLLVAALAVVVAMLLQVIRPIKALSMELHRMDAARGDRLRLPPGHRQSEIGLLVSDINRLADHLVASLDEERTLRIQHEIDEQRYHAIFDNAETGLFIVDSQGFLTSWNPAFARLLHLPPETAPKVSLFSLEWKEPTRLVELLFECLSQARRLSADLHYGPGAGQEHWLNMVLTPIVDQSVQGVIHDVTKHLEAERLAKRLAITDPLTGVVNQLGLERRLLELARIHDLDPSDGFALVLVGLDNFKRIREGTDPTSSDAILCEATQRLSACVKTTDVVARIGVNQFALVLVGLHRDLDAERVTERILSSLQPSFFVAGSPIRLHASAGIAFYPQDTQSDVAELLHHADLALSSVDVADGRRLRFFDPELARLAAHRQRLETDLRRAIQEGQLVAYFQPIVDLEHNRLAGAEVLARWRHPERGLIAPEEFIPLAEDTGLIGDIGLCMLEAAGRQLAAWKREGRSLYLSVNISVRQIPNELPPSLLLDLAQRLDFEPAALALEITEGLLLSDFGGAKDWLDTVRALGFQVYLDDFGTGYSSLSYLKRFTVDRLKVDRSFVSDIDHDLGDQALVAAVTAMARRFNMDVIAEGVENPHHVQLLRSMGCRYAQGYYFAPPIPLASFMEVSERIQAQLCPASTTELH